MFYSSAISMNIFMDCDIDEAEEIGRAAARFTSVNGTLDENTKKGLIMLTYTGYRANVKRAIIMIENKLKELRQRRTGLKPMPAPVFVQGVGSVEASINPNYTNNNYSLSL